MISSPDPQPALGAAVRACREERRRTQRSLAAGAGISVAHLCKIEQGRTNPTWRSVAAVAAGLEISVAELARRAESVAQGTLAAAKQEGPVC